MSRTIVADFGHLSLEALTPFVAFMVHAATNERTGDLVFVLNLPMDGEPEGRDSVVLRQMLRRPSDLIALLLILLAEDEVGVLDALSETTDARPTSSWGGYTSNGLFESFVRTLARDPTKLRAVKRLVDDVRKAEAKSGPFLAKAEQGDEDEVGSTSVIPKRFDQIWEPVWQAALRLGVRDVNDQREGGDAHA